MSLPLRQKAQPLAEADDVVFAVVAKKLQVVALQDVKRHKDVELRLGNPGGSEQ